MKTFYYLVHIMETIYSTHAWTQTSKPLKTLHFKLTEYTS